MASFDLFLHFHVFRFLLDLAFWKKRITFFLFYSLLQYMWVCRCVNATFLSIYDKSVQSLGLTFALYTVWLISVNRWIKLIVWNVTFGVWSVNSFFSTLSSSIFLSLSNLVGPIGKNGSTLKLNKKMEQKIKQIGNFASKTAFIHLL